MDNIFDETDLNLLNEALDCKVRTTAWNLSDPDEFQMLVAYKALQIRVLEQLDGGK